MGVSALGGEGAAPSSHFVFDDTFAGDIVINEVRVPAAGEAIYTYYETLGWGGEAGGYAGLQAHPKGHNYLFSIWDHQSHAAPITAVHRGKGTLIENFGGEGTGLKSWNFELGWQTDVWYTLVARCWPVGAHTHYGFWVRDGQTHRWTHLVTMDVAAQDAYLHGGTDAFIEDWLETGENARTTHLRGGWKRDLAGTWHPFRKGRYAVNDWDLVEGKRSFLYRTNWNGGVASDAEGEFYFMTAGGADTKPEVATPSTHAIERDRKTPDFPRLKFASITARRDPDGTLDVVWEVDPESLPLFAYSITAHDGEKAPALATVAKTEPGARGAQLALPDGADPQAIVVRLIGHDILGNTAEPIAGRVAP